MDEREQSARRIRRGCFGGAVLITALVIMYISATGNLAFSLLLLIVVALLIAAAFIK